MLFEECKSFEEAVELELRILRDMLITKQHDYGHDNINAFGEYGVLVRSNDKIARLKNLLKYNLEPNNEGIQDSWQDLANYAIIALMLRHGTFNLELEG